MSRKLIGILFIILLISLSFGQRYGESDDFSYALKLFNEGFYDIAAQQFNLFVNRYPNSDRVPEARYYLGLSLFNTENYGNARVEFQAMAVSFPDHQRAPEAWKRVGECYKKMNKMEEAARAFETVKVLYPQDPNAPISLFQAGYIYFQEGQYTKAEVAIKDFLDRYPESTDYPRGRLLYAKLLLEKGNVDQAFREFEKVMKSGAGGDLLASAHLGLGKFYSKLGQLEKAKSEFQIVVTQFNSSSSAFSAIIEISRLAAIKKDYESAKKLLNENLTYFKNLNQNTRLKLALSSIYFLEGDYYSGRKLLESISAGSLSDTLKARIYFYLGSFYLEEKNFKLSLEYFSKILNNNQIAQAGEMYVQEAERLIGYTLLGLNQFEQALAQLQTYLNKYPSDINKSTILSDLFYAAQQNNKPNHAESIYQQILSQTPYYEDRDRVLFNLAQYYFRNKNYSQCLFKLNEFMEEYNCSEYYEDVKKYLKIINNHYKVEEGASVTEFAKILGKVLAQENNQKLQLELALINLNQLKNIQEAINLAEIIIQTSQDSSLIGGAYHLIGIGYRRLGELGEFEEKNVASEKLKSQTALKSAMGYLNAIPEKDSLSYNFLQETTGEYATENMPINKKVQFWEHYLKSYPESPFAEKASLKLAELYLADGKDQNAVAILDNIRYSQNIDIAGKAYFILGKFYYNQKNYEKAESILKEYLLNIEIHYLRAEAFAMLAKISEGAHNYKNASQFWTELKSKYDYSKPALAAKTRIPEIFLMAGENQAVIQYSKPYIHIFTSEDLLLNYLKRNSEPIFTFYTGKAYYNLQEDQSARNYLMDYIFSTNNNQYYDEALFLMAEISIEENDRKGAILRLQSIAENPASLFYIQANAKIADIYFEEKEFDKAQQYYTKLISQLDKSEEKTRFQVHELICFLNQGKLKLYDSKIGNFRSTHKNDPNLKNYLANFEFEIGKYYFSQKNYETAIKRFQAVGNNYKKTDFEDDAEYFLGLTYATLNKVEKAQNILSRFSEKYPNSSLKPNVYVTLGGLYYRAEKRELAVGAFQKAVEYANEPDTRMLALSSLITLYRDLGLWDGVLSQTRAYVNEFPDVNDIMDKKILIGSALINLNRYSEAVDFLRELKFEATSEQEPEIQFYIGEAYFNAGQYENAIREFVKIPLLSKQTKLQWEASALYFSGQAYEKLGRKSDAIRMYQEIVDRPGILVELKKEAQKRILQLKNTG